MDTELVAVRTFINHFPAELAKSALEAAGIDAMIRSDDCGGLRPHLWMGGVQVLVRAEDRHRALEVLDEQAIVSDEPPADPEAS